MTDEDKRYSIVRFYADSDHPDHQKVIRSGLTLEEAQAHTNDPATHEQDENGMVVWFDGYAEE